MYKDPGNHNEWAEVTTRKSNLRYYLNLSTFKTSWSLPEDDSVKLVDAFAEIEDPQSHRYYYSNLATGISQWKKPNGRIVPQKYISVPQEPNPRSDNGSGEVINERYEGITPSSSSQPSSFMDHGASSIGHSYSRPYISTDNLGSIVNESYINTLRSPTNYAQTMTTIDHEDSSNQNAIYTSTNNRRQSIFSNDLTLDTDYTDSTNIRSIEYRNESLVDVSSPMDSIGYFKSINTTNVHSTMKTYRSRHNTSADELDIKEGLLYGMTTMTNENRSRMNLQNINTDDNVVKQMTLNRVHRFQDFIQNRLNYWSLKYDNKGVPYYENRITKEKTYVRPLNVKISGIKLVYPSKGGVDNNSFDNGKDTSYHLLALKERIGDMSFLHASRLSTANDHQTKYLFQMEDITKSNQQFTVKRRVNFLYTQNLYLLVNANKAKITLNKKNVQVEEYPIATIKKIEPYKTSEDRVKVIFQVPEGLSISNAVNYKIPKPLVLQFINKKERYIFTNLITYIRRYQNDLIAHRLQSKINSKEHTLGIVKWPVAELSYKGSIPLYLFFYLPLSVVDSGKLKFETRQHTAYKEIPLENVKTIIKGKSGEDELSSVYLITSDNSKMLILFNDKNARDYFVILLHHYITH